MYTDYGIDPGLKRGNHWMTWVYQQIFNKFGFTDRSKEVFDATKFLENIDIRLTDYYMNPFEGESKPEVRIAWFSKSNDAGCIHNETYIFSDTLKYKNNGFIDMELARTQIQMPSFIPDIMQLVITSTANQKLPDFLVKI